MRRVMKPVLAALLVSGGALAATAAPASASAGALLAGSCSMSQNGRTMSYSCYSPGGQNLRTTITCKHSVPLLNHKVVRNEKFYVEGWSSFNLSCPVTYTLANPSWGFSSL